MALMPPFLGREYAERTVFFTTPLRVAKTTKLSSSNSGTRSREVMSSPSRRDRRLVIERPLDVRVASGRL